MSPKHATATEALKASLPQGHAVAVTCPCKAQRREGNESFWLCSRSQPCAAVSGPGPVPEGQH